MLVSGALDFTTVSEIPDDEDLANTYYSQAEDFEEDSFSSQSSESDDDYDALEEHLNNALVLTETCDTMKVESIGPDSCSGPTTIRNKRIEELRE